MKKNGFTFIEVIVAVGILTTLFGIASVSLLRTQRKSNLEATADIFITDLRNQQTKAMAGDAFGLSDNTSYGVFVEADRYTLYRGMVYSPTDPYNFTVEINPALTFTNISLPSGAAVFSMGSGEISGFVPGSNFVILQDNGSGAQLTIDFNRLGVITTN